MYLIIFIIIIILVGILFLQREHLTLEEVRKQIESAGPTLLPQFTRLQYEETIREREAPAKPILESLQNSPEMQAITIKRNIEYGAKLGIAVLNLTNFEKKYKNQIVDIPYTSRVLGQTVNLTRKGLKDPVLDAKFKELNDEIEKIKYEIDKPLTIDEGISIEVKTDIERIKRELLDKGFFGVSDFGFTDDQLIKIAQDYGINTTSPLQQIKDSVADIKEKLRKDDELRKKMEEESRRKDEERERLFRESMARKRKERSKKESTSQRLKRERSEAKAKAKAEAEAEARARAEAEARARAAAEAKARELAEREARERAEREARERAEREARERAAALARERGEIEARTVAESLTQKQELIEQQMEEIAKIREARKEAEEAMNQLRQIPLEERIKRKIFVQPKMVHKPYPFVKSTPANPPYDTTRYEKRENLFKTSEISSIFPRPII